MADVATQGSGFAAVVATLTAEGGPFEVVTEDVAGIPTQVYRNRTANLRDVFTNAEAFADRVAFVQDERRVTFGELRSLVGSTAAGLADLGVGPGDRVAIVAANSPDWLVAFWATLCLGAVSVPLNAWWKTEELAFVLEDCAAKVAVCDRRRWDVIGHLSGEIPTLEHILVVEAPDSPLPEGAEAFGPLTTAAPEAALPDAGIDEDDVAVLLYTSGTTGKPKGSIQTHRSTIANFMNMSVRTIAATMAAAGDTSERPKPRDVPQTTWLLIVPLFHVTGLFTCAVPQMVIGGKIAFMPHGRFDPDVAMGIIEAEDVTLLSGVPTVMQRILASPNFAKFDLTSVAQASYGGAPAPTSLQRDLSQKLPWLSGGGPMTAYGLTETAGVVCVNSGAEYSAKPDSVGPTMPTLELRIVGPGGEDVPSGERGEIWVKGPIVSPGYWNRPEANAETFTDGWLHTGDIGKVDAEGFLFILDRAKDMIIRGGENVYCAEVEDVIDRHPAVVEAAVIGEPDEDLGEKVKAVVVLRPGENLGLDDLRTFCAEHLAHYKVPELAEFRTEHLPRNPAGKVLKSALRGHDHSFSTDGESDSIL